MPAGLCHCPPALQLVSTCLHGCNSLSGGPGSYLLLVQLPGVWIRLCIEHMASKLMAKTKQLSALELPGGGGQPPWPIISPAPLGESLGGSEVPLLPLPFLTLWTLGVPEGGCWRRKAKCRFLLCGSPALAKILKGHCEQFSFKFFQENF